jgi:translation initiation factor IF-2
MDLDKAKENITDFEQFLKSDDTTKDINVLKVSGKQGLNIAELLHFIRLMYDQYNTNNEKTSNENEINSSLA